MALSITVLAMPTVACRWRIHFTSKKKKSLNTGRGKARKQLSYNRLPEWAQFAQAFRTSRKGNLQSSARIPKQNPLCTVNLQQHAPISSMGERLLHQRLEFDQVIQSLNGTPGLWDGSVHMSMLWSLVFLHPPTEAQVSIIINWAKMPSDTPVLPPPHLIKGIPSCLSP